MKSNLKLGNLVNQIVIILLQILPITNDRMVRMDCQLRDDVSQVTHVLNESMADPAVVYKFTQDCKSVSRMLKKFNIGRTQQTSTLILSE